VPDTLADNPGIFMIYSMTGYGSGGAGNDSVWVELESRSINHRYLDIRVRMPKELSFLESRARKILQKRFFRGHFDVFITLIPTGEAARRVCFDEKLACQFIDMLRGIDQQFSLNDKVQLSSLIQFRELFTIEEVVYEQEILQELVEKALLASLDDLNKMRQEEGRLICEELEARLDKIGTMIVEIERRLPQVAQEYRQRLHKKVSDLIEGMKVDEERLLQEVVFYAERSDVTEELVRMKAHIDQFRTFLDESSDSVGKKLDFLVQEMNREANTTGSKSSDVEITQKIVLVKSELEKIREQVQNVE
jgi:uncharacterized protein (TIGR00255 family)